jgi:transposase
VRGRLDWKYCLGLELDDEGFDFSVLSEFRSRLVADAMEAALLEALLARLGELGLVGAGCGSGPILPMCWGGSGR